MNDKTLSNLTQPVVLVGATTVVAGLALLLSTFDVVHVGNWWALFFLFPALYFLTRAYQGYSQGEGKAVGNWIWLSLTILFFMVVFLSGIDWEPLWPAFIVIGGLGMVLRAIFK